MHKDIYKDHKKKQHKKVKEKHNFWTAYTYKYRRYVKFSKTEITNLFWAILTAAFVFTFNKWGVVTFDFERGFANLFIAFFFIAIFYVFNIYLKKIFAVWLGYTAEYKMSMYGIFVMIVIAFISYGFIPFLMLGYTYMYHSNRRRLGGWRYYLKQIDYLKIHALSYLFNYLIVIFILGPIYFYTNSHFIYLLMIYNIAIIFYSLLPIPQNDGLMIFFCGKAQYILLASFVLLMSALLLWAHIYSFVIAAIIGLIAARFISVTLTE